MRYPTLLRLAGFTLASSVGLVAAPPEADPDAWQAVNRTATHHADHVHLDAKADAGVLWLRDVEFGDGTITFEVKGRDVRGQSFVGLAFHGADDRTYDSVYFRPFNFHAPETASRAVQYISLPDHDWFVLRSSHPGRFENAVRPAPDSNDWFLVRIVVEHPRVTVFVGDAAEPSLEVEQLSDRRTGRIGFWVGNGSEGWFRNLRLEPSELPSTR